jgi:hypothetical protein
VKPTDLQKNITEKIDEPAKTMPQHPHTKTYKNL